MVNYCNSVGMSIPLPRNLLENHFLRTQLSDEEDFIYLNAERDENSVWREINSTKRKFYHNNSKMTIYITILEQSKTVSVILFSKA